jgi:hypothetical protein
MLSIIEVKWSMMGRRMFMVIIGELCHNGPFCPIILLIIAKYSEICNNLLIYAFCLAIGLWVVGGRNILFYTK